MGSNSLFQLNFLGSAFSYKCLTFWNQKILVTLKVLWLINNKLHGLSLPGGFVSPFGRFASLLFDQAIPKNFQRHLADGNDVCILHQSDCAWLCCLSSQFKIQPYLNYYELQSFMRIGNRDVTLKRFWSHCALVEIFWP